MTEKIKSWVYHAKQGNTYNLRKNIIAKLIRGMVIRMQKKKNKKGFTLLECAY